MRLRTRVTVGAGAAVLVAVIAVSITVYAVVSNNLHNQIDESLEHNQQGALTHELEPASQLATLVDDFYLQTVDADGAVDPLFEDRLLPVTDDVLAVARGERGAFFFDADLDGTPARVFATPAGPGTALMAGRSLADVEQTLRNLAVALTAISLAAVGLAALIGRLVAAAAVAPVHRVADAAESVARTGDLSRHIAVPGSDDLGRLADSFNTMLDALSASLDQQRQLVADASHELRTPLATVRTNVEVLARADELDSAERTALIDETVAQIGELTRLVGDLVELARGDGREEPFTAVDLAASTRHAVDLIARAYPGLDFRVVSRPSLIRGAPERVSRAVSNLVDNAAKWSPPGGAVEVSIAGGAVAVRDHGPGVSDADLPHIFDRFYRSPTARTMTGSGLGLAIVKQVADSHGGNVLVEPAQGGGTRFVLRFPTLGHAEYQSEFSSSSHSGHTVHSR